MTIALRKHVIYQSPNIWDRAPVVHCIVDASTTPPELLDPAWLRRQLASLAHLVLDGFSLEPLPLDQDVCLGASIARIALDLQRVAGVPVWFSYGRQRTIDDGFDVVVQHRHAEVGLQAVKVALEWMSHLLDPSDETSFDLDQTFERFAFVNETNDGGVTGRALVAAAELRGIPITLLDPRGRIAELGNGRYRKHVGGARTALTSAIGVEISQDKDLTNHYLRLAGLPVPDGIAVRSLAQALAAARSLGFPVTIKPLDLGNSVGVEVDLRDDDDVRASFDATAAAAATGNGKIMVEQFIQGNDFRVLIVNDRVVQVRQRIRPEITGDGVHTVQQLIDIENSDPRRGTRTQDIVKTIMVDELMLRSLARLNLTLDDVPIRGQRIVLNLTGNRQNGAIHVDRTDDIHPENATLLRAAARVIGLDIAGIDVISPDIAQPILQTGGAIIEINDSPAINLHLMPRGGPPRDPSPVILDMLFPPGQPVRVPVAAVAATGESATICQGLARALSDAGSAVGLATRDGLVVDGLSYPHAMTRNPAGPRTILNNPMVEIAVVEIDAESIEEAGLGFDKCDVAVVLSLCGLETPFGQPAEIVLLRTLDPNGVAVLNGAEPLLCERAAEVPGRVIWVGLEPGDAQLPQLLEHGNRAIVTRETPTGWQWFLVSSTGEQELSPDLWAGCGEPREGSPLSRTAIQAVIAVRFALGPAAAHS